MIKVRSGIAITPELVTKLIEHFNGHYLPRFQRLRKYFAVENDILDRVMKDSDKPNNKMAHGLAKYIAKMSTGFFMGEGIRITTADSGYKEYLDELLKDGATGDPSYELAKEMAITGVAYEYLYINEKTELRSTRFQAEEIIPVYSLSIGNFLEFAVRMYTEHDWVTDKKKRFAEVYTADQIITYEEQADKYVELSDRTPHNIGDVPIIAYWNNEERKGDFEDVITLIDAYDKGQSDTLNDFDYFTDAYLVIVGANGLTKGEPGEEEDGKSVRDLKRERVLFLDEKGQADWLVKQTDDTSMENFKTRVRNDVFFLSQVPALSDESFAGNLSGVALRYKLFGLEQLAAEKEKKFLPAYKKKIRLLTKYLYTRYNRQFDASTVEVKFDRNKIDNLLDLANVIALLDGKVSRETLLELLPFIKDAKSEITQLLAEIIERNELTEVDEEKILAFERQVNG